MSDAEKVLSILSKSQLEFIQDELGHDPGALKVMDDEAISSMYDRLCDIEVDETVDAGDCELSERGKMVEGIVTVIGNELYRPDWDEFAGEDE